MAAETPTKKVLSALLLPEIGPKVKEIHAWKNEHNAANPKSYILNISLVLPEIGPLADKIRSWKKVAAPVEVKANEKKEEEKKDKEKKDEEKKEKKEEEERKSKPQEPTSTTPLPQPNTGEKQPGSSNKQTKYTDTVNESSSTTKNTNASSTGKDGSDSSSTSKSNGCKDQGGKKFNFSIDKERKEQVKAALEDLKIFSEMVKKRHERWIPDVTAMIKNGETNMKPDEKQNTDNPNTIQDRLMYHIKRLLRGYASKSSINWAMMKEFYMKTHRKQVRSILRYINSEENKGEFQEEARKLFESYTKAMKTSHDSLYKELMRGLDSFTGKYASFDDDKQALVSKMIEDKFEKISHQRQKINSLYELKYSILEMIIDTQFYVLYVIKALRILFAYVALFLTTRMFVPIYEDTVYDSKKDPPGLWKFMLIYLAFDVSLNVFLLVLMYLLKYLFKSDENSFVIDNLLIGYFITDYIIGMVIIMILGMLIGRIIVQKKYFKYKYEGVRAIRAFEKIVFFIAIIMIVIPFYMIY
jgi:hypothetical protein